MDILKSKWENKGKEHKTEIILSSIIKPNAKKLKFSIQQMLKVCHKLNEIFNTLEETHSGVRGIFSES